LAEKKISTHDLARLAQITKEMAEMHQQYIKMGYTSTEIAETFGRIYFHEFGDILDEEGLKCLRRELSANSQMCGSGTTFEATGRMCIHIASGFLRAVAKKMNE